MLVLKKKEIVAAALVVLIGVAGYLNWSYQDTVRVTDGEAYRDSAKKLGEAQLVKETEETVETASSSVGGYFDEARMEKENARSKALEILNQTASNESFDEETKKNAREKILDMAANTEKEAVIENIAKAKGYEEISVYIDGESADIILSKKDFSEKDAALIKEIVTEQVNISPSSIKIVEKK